jgi:hypothetical protein
MDFIFIETYHIISYIKAEFQLRIGLELGHVTLIHTF